MKFWNLYRKDVSSNSFFLIIITFIILAWNILFVSQSALWGGEITIIFNIFPLFFYPLMMFWLGIQSFRREWHDGTMYFVLSLPESGWQINGIKLLANLTCYIFISLISLFIIFVFYSDLIRRGVSIIPYRYMSVEIFIKLYLYYILIGLQLYILSQFSYLVSRFVSRFRGLVTIVVFIFTFIFYNIFSNLLTPLFNWAPDFIFSGLTYNYQISLFHNTSAGLLANVVVLLLIFLTGSFLIKNYLEV